MALPCPSRVVVSVAPRVFGDALSVALSQHDLVVTVMPSSEAVPSSGEHYDVAVISSAHLPAGFVADVVIRIPDAADPAGVGTLADTSGCADVPIRDLTDIVALVNDCAARRREPQREG